MKTYYESLVPQSPDSLIEKLSAKTEEIYDYFGKEIYSNTNRQYLDKQIDRMIETVKAHKENYGDVPVYLMRAPGRLNAFLEYLDMCAGDHMSTTIDGDVPMCVSLREDGLISAKNTNPLFDDELIDVRKAYDDLKKQSWENYSILPDNWDNRTKMYPFAGREKGLWTNYILSPFLRIMWNNPHISLKGVNLTLGPANAPFRAGTSSSSIIVVLSFLALGLANPEIIENMTVDKACAMLGEAEWYVGTHGGANDQTTILRNKMNSVSYNRHSHPSLTATNLPFLKGVSIVLANSLWEVNKSLGGNQSFNMRKGWMEIGDRVMIKNLDAVKEAIAKGENKGCCWIEKLISGKFGYSHIGHLPQLETDMSLWEKIFANYKKFGSLSSEVLGIPNSAVDELIRTLPIKINVAEAAEILDMQPTAIEQMYTKPKRKIGGYHVRTTARFFHKENIFGRQLEKIFIEADEKLKKGILTADSPEYDSYRKELGRTIEDVQHVLCYDFRISNAQIDKILSIARRGSGYLGGKLTGAGKGGCVAIFVREEYAEEMCRHLDEYYYANLATFEEYRLILEDALKYFVDDKYETVSAKERLRNLDYALSHIDEQRRVITFSKGAGFINL
ncbi:MAG: hypothetical protein KBT47_07410 [Armatimonadetes bacterium]|nr:hypothetical protein [Candidatus Hippobium faecium]